MNHDDYDEDYLSGILAEVKSIAMVGASADKKRPSYSTMRTLLDKGYDVIPVNPDQVGHLILGAYCYASLEEIDRSVDMVNIFRNSDAAFKITQKAIEIDAKVVWMQLGVRNDDAARLAETAGLKVVMDRCPKIELFRPLWKSRLNPTVWAAAAGAARSLASLALVSQTNEAGCRGLSAF